jgi:hypothetical protein
MPRASWEAATRYLISWHSWVSTTTSRSISRILMPTRMASDQTRTFGRTRTALIQAALSERLNIQVEADTSATDRGDIFRAFDPDNAANVRVKDDQSLYRVGGKLDIAPGQSIVLSSIYQTRDISLFTIDVGQGVTFDIWSSAMEAQYSLVEPGFNLIAGAGHLRGFLAQPETGFSVDSYFSNAYVYALVKPQNSGLKLSFGASMDTLDENALHRSELCPKLGLIWNPIASTTIRAASIKTLKRPLVGNETIEPTQIAGFDQFFEDVDGAVSWLYGVGVDQRLGSIHVGLQASQRDIHVPLVLPDSTIDIYWKERAGTAYVYWPIASDRQRLLLPSWFFAALLRI